MSSVFNVGTKWRGTKRIWINLKYGHILSELWCWIIVINLYNFPVKLTFKVLDRKKKSSQAGLKYHTQIKLINRQPDRAMHLAVMNSLLMEIKWIPLDWEGLFRIMWRSGARLLYRWPTPCYSCREAVGTAASEQHPVPSCLRRLKQVSLGPCYGEVTGQVWCWEG